MRIIVIVVTVVLIALMAADVAAFSMPSLLGRPIVPGFTQRAAPELPSRMPTPEDVTGQAAGETFTLTISGNVYVDKLPVTGAEVTLYLNGRQAGKTTAGDLYQFSVPGVRNGDQVRVDAKYEGHTGSATETVKFKSMYLDVNIRSGKSFIRNALEMLPTKDDLSSPQQQSAASTGTPSQASQSSGTPAQTTSSANAEELTSQVMGDTSKSLLNIFDWNNARLTQPVSTSTAGVGSNMMITSLDDAMKIAGVEAPVIS
ncbi:MAG: hypothetical protein A4E28_01068 [Methanocella sp. PtaU1.Bin125]|nr:MAG: hypothetical protein A4E28_01068 [Methanocella sp. PtaU1.Bin125]